MSDLRKAAEQMLDAVDAALNAAYDRVFPVCCGKGSESGCCGQPDQTWTPQDEALMALLAPVERNLRTALAAEQPKHPGYIIGSHWLETAYSRICAGEAEADVLRDCGWERVDDAEALRRDAERYKLVLNWLVKNGLLTWERCRIDTPESFGDWWILRKPKVIDGSSLLGYGKTENAAIDAAMGDKR